VEGGGGEEEVSRKGAARPIKELTNFGHSRPNFPPNLRNSPNGLSSKMLLSTFGSDTRSLRPAESKKLSAPPLISLLAFISLLSHASSIGRIGVWHPAFPPSFPAHPTTTTNKQTRSSISAAIATTMK
jgi:hypothetical protein